MGLSGSLVFAQLVLRSNFTRELTYAAADLEKFKKTVDNVADKAKQVGTVWTTRVTLPIVGGIGAITKAAVDFESSFAGIKKTVAGMVDDSGKLSTAGAKVRAEMRALAREIPVSVHELNAIGETAGALGLGGDKIAGFTKVMASLGVTTDLTTQAATEGIAKIQNIYHSAGVDTDRFASALVALGNEGASTESAILAMAGRIAGTGQVIGITQAQVLGLSSALASVDIEAEMGGTAMSRVMINMANAIASGSAEVEEFGRVSGVSGLQFAQHFKEDAAGAIGDFVVGLKRVSGEGENLFATLEKLNLDEIRVRDTLLRAMGASDLFTKSLRTANAAWKENSALQKEAAQRFATVASQLTLFWNRIVDIAITLGNTFLPAVRALLGALHALLTPLESLINAYAALPTIVHLAVGGFLLLIASLGPLAIILATVAGSAVALSGTFYILKSAFLVIRGEALQAPAALKALAYLLDNLASITLKNGAISFTFREVLHKTMDAVGRYTTRLLTANATAIEMMKTSSLGTALVGQWNVARTAVSNYATQVADAAKATTALAKTRLTAIVSAPIVQKPLQTLKLGFTTFMADPAASVVAGLDRAFSAISTKVGAAATKMSSGFKGAIDALGAVMRGFTLDLSRNITFFSEQLAKGSRAVGEYAGAAGHALWAGLTRPADDAKVNFKNLGDWGKAALKGLGEAALWLGGVLVGLAGVVWTVVKAFFAFVDLAVLAAALFVWMVAQIPGMTGAFGDLGAILVNLVIIAWNDLTATIGGWASAAKSALDELDKWTFKMIQSIPGWAQVAAAYEWATKKLQEWRKATDEAAAGPKFNDIVGPLPDLPKTPDQTPKRKGVFTPEKLDTLEWLARDLGYVGDASDRAAMQMVVLTSAYQNAVNAANALPPRYFEMIKAAKAANATEDELAQILIEGGVAKELAATAIKVLTDRIDDQRQAEDKAIQKSEAYRQKILQLTEAMNGMGAVKAGHDILTAFNAARTNTTDMSKEDRAALHSQVEGVLPGLRTQINSGKASAATKALAMELQILYDKTKDLSVGIHQVWVTGADGIKYMTWVGKDAEAMFEGLRASNAKMAEDASQANYDKAAAKLAELTAAQHENWAASKALKLETRDLWIAANDSGVDTLQKRMDAVTLSYADQRNAIDEVTEGQLGYAEYVDRLNNLSAKEAAQRAQVTTEYINSLPPTKALLVLRKQEEIQGLKTAIALTANALALGVLNKRLKEAEEELRRLNGQNEGLAKWATNAAKRFGELSQAVGAFADLFEGEMNRVLKKTAEVLAALQTFFQGMAEFASGDKISGTIGMIIGGIQLIGAAFDIGATEYEKNAQAAGASFQELRTNLLDTYGDYNRLRQIAERTNTTIGNLQFDPHGDAFQQLDTLKKEAKALEAAIAKLKAGLEMFAGGAKTRLDAFAGAFKVIGADGKATDDVSLATGLKKLGGTRTQVEAEFQRMGTYAGAAFLQTLREEGMAKAMDVAGPLFDTITTLGDKVGLGLHGAAKAMADFFKVAKDNADVVQALDGIQQMIRGASDAAFLNQEMFDAFGEDVSLQFQRLQERGVGAGTAMALMQPTLQALWEAQKKYGFATDETTQALIDQAVAAGIVGENQRDVNQQILDVLTAIAKVMGAEIPGAMGEMASAAEREAARVKNALDDATRDRTTTIHVNHDDPGVPGGDSGSGGGDGGGGEQPNQNYMGGIVRRAMGGFVPMNCATGGFIRPLLRAGGGGIDWTPKGTDTVPTLLTPGELVLNVAQQRNVGAALSNDPKALASAIASALKEGGIGGGEAGVVVLHSNGKPGDQFNAVLDSLPRALRQNKNGLRTALREALGIDA